MIVPLEYPKEASLLSAKLMKALFVQIGGMESRECLLTDRASVSDEMIKKVD